MPLPRSATKLSNHASCQWCKSETTIHHLISIDMYLNPCMEIPKIKKALAV